MTMIDLKSEESSSKVSMKIILYIMFISLIPGRLVPLPRTPARSSNHPQGNKIPSYMMKLYQTLMSNKKGNYRPEEQILEESDIIQSFTAKNFIVEDNRWSLTFDFSTVSRNDELRMVELQVYLPPFTTYSNVTVDIYHINSGGNKLFLGSVTTNLPNKLNSSWTTFNVTKMIEQSPLWGKKPTIHQEGGLKSEDMSDHERSRRKRDVSLHEINKDQAIIVFFTKHNPLLKPETHSLIKKLALDTMKTVEFHGPKMETHLHTPSNVYPTIVEEQRPSYTEMDRMRQTKIFSKYKPYPSLRGSALLYLREHKKDTKTKKLALD
ncbi:nodal homolog 3-A-like [Leptodactylus fuscus]|uniref:nodal homolog 3-A-like n=1 Tax=Leptodactylus fuscus TaxID=238119 RepID=UPI003F4EEEB4